MERDFMAATAKTIDLNKWLVLEATDRTARFVPYKENFVTPVAKGGKLFLKAYTVGQYLYYTKNGFTEYTGDPKSTSSDFVINVPATITIKNESTKDMNFIPYRENFQVTVKPGEGYSFKVETAGQVLYYMSQDTTGIEVGTGLEVDQNKVE
jgi:hypothetical protein